MTIPKEFLQSVIEQCNEAAEKASAEWLANAKPRFAVYNSDLSGKYLGGPVDTMLDNCGFSRLVIKDKRSEFFKSLVKSGIVNKDRYTAIVPVSYSLQCRQEMGLHEAAMEAAKKVMEKFGFDIYVRVWTYID